MKSRQKVSTHEVAHFPERMPMWMAVGLTGAGHFYAVYAEWNHKGGVVFYSVVRRDQLGGI